MVLNVFHCMFGYSWFVGGLGATLAAQYLGALVIPGGSVDTAESFLNLGTLPFVVSDFRFAYLSHPSTSFKSWPLWVDEAS